MPLSILGSLAALPLVVGCIFAAIAWPSLSRPVLFTIGGIVEGYIVLGAVLYWAMMPLTTIGISGVAPGETPAGPLEPFGRLLFGVPIAVSLQLLAMWATHRAVAT